jgi:hypothetical protein
LHGVPPDPEVNRLECVAHFSRLVSDVVSGAGAELAVFTGTPTLESCIVKHDTGVFLSKRHLHGVPPDPEVNRLECVAHFSWLVPDVVLGARAEPAVVTGTPALEICSVKYGACVLVSERNLHGVPPDSEVNRLECVAHFSWCVPDVAGAGAGAEPAAATGTPALQICIVKYGTRVLLSERNLHGVSPDPEVNWLECVAHWLPSWQGFVAKLAVATVAPTIEVGVGVVKHGAGVITSERDACGAAREYVGAAGGRTRCGVAITDVSHCASHRHHEADVVELCLSNVSVAVCVRWPCAGPGEALRGGWDKLVQQREYGEFMPHVRLAD